MVHYMISLTEINNDFQNRLQLYQYFIDLYSNYLGRALERGEASVLTTAIKIMLWRVHGKTFKNICWNRYAYASKSYERERLEKSGRRTDDLEAAFFVSYNDMPDKTLPLYNSLINVKAKDVDYDFIMYDTYDYLDKLIGFKLSDVFYATFFRYFQATGDERANKLAKIIKYGTDNDRHIWLLRYGLSFEDIEKFDHLIESVDAREIIFNDSIYEIPEQERKPIERFLMREFFG